MEKHVRFLPLGLLVAFVAKILFVSASPADAGIVFSLALLSSLSEYPFIFRKISGINDKLDAQQAEIDAWKAKVKTLEASLSGLKLGMGARTVTNGKI